MGIQRKTSHTYKVAEAKAKLSELLARAEAGEEVIIARGNDQIVKLVPIRDRKRPTPGGLKRLITSEQADALTKAVLAPYSKDDERILAGDGTNEVGIWIGLSEDRESSVDDPAG